MIHTFTPFGLEIAHSAERMLIKHKDILDLATNQGFFYFNHRGSTYTVFVDTYGNIEALVSGKVV